MKLNLRQNIFGWIMTVFLIIALIGLVMLKMENRRLNDFKQSHFDRQKEINDSIINLKNLEIDSLILSNELKDDLINAATENFDSLSSLKDSIRIIYKTKYKEVENFSATSIIKYWGDEFD